MNKPSIYPYATRVFIQVPSKLFFLVVLHCKKASLPFVTTIFFPLPNTKLLLCTCAGKSLLFPFFFSFFFSLQVSCNLFIGLQASFYCRSWVIYFLSPNALWLFKHITGFAAEAISTRVMWSVAITALNGFGKAAKRKEPYTDCCCFCLWKKTLTKLIVNPTVTKQSCWVYVCLLILAIGFDDILNGPSHKRRISRTAWGVCVLCKGP